MKPPTSPNRASPVDSTGRSNEAERLIATMKAELSASASIIIMN